MLAINQVLCGGWLGFEDQLPAQTLAAGWLVSLCRTSRLAQRETEIAFYAVQEISCF